MLLAREGMDFLHDRVFKLLKKGESILNNGVNQNLGKEELISFATTLNNFLTTVNNDFVKHVENSLSHLKQKENVIERFETAIHLSDQLREEGKDFLRIEGEFGGLFLKLYKYLKYIRVSGKKIYDYLIHDVNHKNLYDDPKLFSKLNRNERLKKFIDACMETDRIIQEITFRSDESSKLIQKYKQHFQEQLEFLRDEKEEMQIFENNMLSWVKS